MGQWTEILKTVLPVLLMLLLGVLCRRRRLITREGLEALKTVAVQIGLPAVLLHTFASMAYSWKTMALPLIMFAVCVAAWLLGGAAGRRLGLNSRFVPFLTTGFEAGMLGYALFALLYGSDRVSDFARVDLGQVLFVFTLYKVLLARAEGQRASASQLAREMASSPIILAIAAGVLLGATGAYQALIPSGAAGVLDACTDFISAPVSGLILLAVGYDLRLEEVPWRRALATVGLRLAVMAVLGGAVALLLRLLWPEEDLSHALLMMFLLPPPFVLPVFATDEAERGYVASVLSLSTLVTILGFALMTILVKAA